MLAITEILLKATLSNGIMYKRYVGLSYEESFDSEPQPNRGPYVEVQVASMVIMS